MIRNRNGDRSTTGSLRLHDHVAAFLSHERESMTLKNATNLAARKP